MAATKRSEADLGRREDEDAPLHGGTATGGQARAGDHPLPWHAPTWTALLALKPRLPHALLLHGPRGIGKQALALRLAGALLCESPPADGSACGHCAGCRLVAAGSHPDLRVVMPEADQDSAPEGDDMVVEAPPAAPAAKGRRKPSRQIRIAQVRALADFLTVTTHRAGLRVAVVVPADALNEDSASALLKMLEEPPPSTLWVLVAHEADDVLATIRSRCVLQRVAAPAPAAALQWLREQGVADAEARLAEAGGAPLEALQPDADDTRRLRPEQRTLLLDLLARGPRLAPADIAARVPKDLPLPASIALFQRWGWDLSSVSLTGAVRYHPSHEGVLRAIAAAAAPAALLDWCDTLREARAVADHPSLNARLAVESALIRYGETLRASRPEPEHR